MMRAGATNSATNEIWNGFEWVSPERYLDMRATSMPELPELASLGQRGPAPAIPDSPPWAGGPSGPAPWEMPPASPPRPLNVLTAQMLRHIDPSPMRPGLLETPDRVAAAWKEWTCGYAMDPAEVFKVFEDGAEGCDEMVVVHDIPVYSHCEHHLAAIFGTATVAYIPNGKIVGLSKLPRLVDIFARRLQVQERLTNQVADAIITHLQPRGCGVVVKARHMCMESRGIKQPGSYTTTSALRGVFKEDPSARAEFLSLAYNPRQPQ